jgi:SAM-dependent methyltransferase
VSRVGTFSTGYDRSKLRSYVSLLKYHWQIRRSSPLSEYDRFRQAKEIFDRYGSTPVRDSTVLEIGSGQRFTVTLLFHSLGAKSTGIDTDQVIPVFSVPALRAIWRRNGSERALKTLIRFLVFDNGYYRRLSQLFGEPLRRKFVDVRVMDARDLHFPDGSFDFVCSFSVFEHINDIDQATREMARVLKPGGIAYVVVHLFPSLSGGHHFEWFNADKRLNRKVPPWDHLRQNRYPSQSYLNKLRERDYIETFTKYLSILDLDSKYGGEALLTDEIERELADYTREDLLKNSIWVVMTKQPVRQPATGTEEGRAPICESDPTNSPVG